MIEEYRAAWYALRIAISSPNKKWSRKELCELITYTELTYGIGIVGEMLDVTNETLEVPNVYTKS